MRAKTLGADGEVWLSRKEAAAYCGVSISSVRAAEARNELRVRAARGGVRLISKRALDDWRTRVGRAPESMREAVAALDAGADPRELVRLLGCSPERAQSFVQSLRWLSGAWIVEGPSGSREAWCRAYGYDAITPHQLRRTLELAACIPGLRALVRGEPSFHPSTALLITTSAEQLRVPEVANAITKAGYGLMRSHTRQQLDRLLEQARSAELVLFVDPKLGRSGRLWSCFGAMCERAQWSRQHVVLWTERAKLPALPHGVHVVRSSDELALFVRVRNAENAA